MSSIIDIQDLGKEYRIASGSSYLSLRDEIYKSASNIFRRKKEKQKFWALDHINLQVAKGERIGIIGRNGAGKSTLLKIISRITPPTTGKVTINGRVASLLEVGTGFHPELTGRENIYFNGSILGLRKKEIDNKLDAIIDFSGIERFIDMPLKHYSSGMQLRLAFSVAAHLEPEVLLIDEVLAVGDMEFQKKCIGKIEEVSNSDGRTILFVSHNMNYITTLCNTAVLLDIGQIVKQGPTNDIISHYLSNNKFASIKEWTENKPGNSIVNLTSLKMIDENGDAQSGFKVNELIGIEMRYEVLEDGHILWLGHNVHNEMGINIFDTHSVKTELYEKPHQKGHYSAIAWVPRHFLNTGNFIVSTAIFNHLKNEIHLHVKDAIQFTVHEDLKELTARGMSPGEFPGVVRPFLKWNINKL